MSAPNTMRLSVGAQLKRYRDGRCEIVGVYPGNGHSAGDLGVPVGSFVVTSDDIPIDHIVDENFNWIADKRLDVPMAWKVVDGAGNDLGMFYPAFETINEDDDSIQVRPAFEDPAEADDVPGQEPTKPFKQKPNADDHGTSLTFEQIVHAVDQQIRERRHAAAAIPAAVPSSDLTGTAVDEARPAAENADEFIRRECGDYGSSTDRRRHKRWRSAIEPVWVSCRTARHSTSSWTTINARAPIQIAECSDAP